MDWNQAVQRSIDRFGERPRKYSAEISLALVDLAVLEGTISEEALQQLAPPQTPNQADFVGTIMGHVTTAVHGGGDVPSIGGWYRRNTDLGTYEINPGFAAAWKAKRGIETNGPPLD